MGWKMRFVRNWGRLVMKSEWKQVVLKDVLTDKGYIRGPFGSALKRPDMLSTGVPVYEQQHAIYNKRDFRFFVSKEKFEEFVSACSHYCGRKRN